VIGNRKELFAREMARELHVEICDTITEKFEEVWKETVESFVERVDRVCEDLPWPLDWVCHAVVTIVKVVTIVMHTVTKTVVTVVCYTVSALAAVAGAIIGTVFAVPVLGTWVKALGGAVIWAGSQFVGALDAGLGLIGIRPIKQLRLHLIILMREDGSFTVPPDAVQLCIDRTADILRRRADIRLTTTVHQVSEPSVNNALHVDSDAGLFAEDMGDAGTYFQLTIRDLLFEHEALFALRLGAPVVAFAVDGVGNRLALGCSAGPLADYVCVEGAMLVTPPLTDSNGLSTPVPSTYTQSGTPTMANAATTLAHEICHALGLAHDGLFNRGGGSLSNLMFNIAQTSAGLRGDNLSPFQRAIIRSSQHVTYL